jgi:hypothetical protein
MLWGINTMPIIAPNKGDTVEFNGDFKYWLTGPVKTADLPLRLIVVDSVGKTRFSYFPRVGDLPALGSSRQLVVATPKVANTGSFVIALVIPLLLFGFVAAIIGRFGVARRNQP